jgi:hypothetical protein
MPLRWTAPHSRFFMRRPEQGAPAGSDGRPAPGRSQVCSSGLVGATCRHLDAQFLTRTASVSGGTEGGCRDRGADCPSPVG